MPYELKYIKKAIERLSLTPRGEGETAFPALATVLEEVRAEVRADRPSEPTSGDRWAAHVEEFHKHPPAPLDDELQARVNFLNEKFSMKKPKEIDTTPVMVCCPHCSQELPVATNLRFWTVEEIREFANVLERNQAIAAANREANRIAHEAKAAELTAEGVSAC